jgi:hypothetical protein
MIYSILIMPDLHCAKNPLVSPVFGSCTEYIGKIPRLQHIFGSTTEFTGYSRNTDGFLAQCENIKGTVSRDGD